MYLIKLKRRIHISWLIAGFSAGVIVGVISSQWLSTDYASGLGWFLAGLALAGLAVWRGKVWCLVLVILAGLIIGGWRGSSVQLAMMPYENLVGTKLTVAGKVAEDADTGRGDEVILRLKDVEVGDNDLPGRIWLTLSTDAEIKRGDTVTVRGKVEAGFGSFSAAIYRAELLKLESTSGGDVALKTRDNFADKIRQVISEPEASLGIGYLTGQRRALPPELEENLKIAGLTHVVVASGYNLTILVRLARRLFVKVSKYLAAFSAGGMIVAFIAVTGLSPSMSRAGLVAGLSLLAWYYGRRIHPLVLLPFVAAVSLLVNPSYGWNDLGWLLSFAAFFGVLVLAPLLQSYFFGNEKPGNFRQILVETFSAQAMTLPIIAVSFGVISNVALIANLLVLPLVPLAMLLVFLSGISAIILPNAVASVIAAPASWLLSYMTSVTDLLASLSWAESQVEVGFWAAGTIYLVIVLIIIYMWKQTGSSLREHNIIE